VSYSALCTHCRWPTIVDPEPPEPPQAPRAYRVSLVHAHCARWTGALHTDSRANLFKGLLSVFSAKRNTVRPAPQCAIAYAAAERLPLEATAGLTQATSAVLLCLQALESFSANNPHLMSGVFKTRGD
jgi:hypothetical protein